MQNSKNVRTSLFAKSTALLTCLLAIAPSCVKGQDPPASQSPADQQASLQIDLARPGHKISPTFYGLMTEEINHSYDGGLYGELIQNRNFLSNANNPVHWTLEQNGGASATMTLDHDQALSAALPVSLRVDVAKAGETVISNDGYWGIPIRSSTRYIVSLYAKSAPGFSGPLTISLQSTDGQTTYASGQVTGLGVDWKQYKLDLTTIASDPSAPIIGRFAISTNQAGTFWLDLVSLFPPTYKNQANGFRPDLMEKLADMKPTFLRLPGGNYVEGNNLADRYDWKKTVGPLIDRPGHPSPWGYRSTDGLGLLEYLKWCEDLHMQPVLAVFAGYTLNGQHVDAGPDLAPYVQDALDEIEYVTGGADTKWGAERIRDGHPKPFPLKYIEVGNEDGFDKSGSYEARYVQFYDAIKAKYPQLQIIATVGGKDSIGQRYLVTQRKPDAVDEHYYLSSKEMEREANRFDSYDRNGPKVFVGEWAAFDDIAPWQQARSGGPTSSFKGALADAAWMAGMERNSDIVVMESYAPLFVDVNPGGRQWTVNLIGYDALSSFGAPSYYVQCLFAHNTGDVTVPATLTGDQIYRSVSRDSKNGNVYVKLVNVSDSAQDVHLTFDGAGNISPNGTVTTFTSDSLTAINTLDAPTAIVPSPGKTLTVSKDFTYTMAPRSIAVLRLNAR